jgi:hypothetical protein
MLQMDYWRAQHRLITQICQKFKTEPAL